MLAWVSSDFDFGAGDTGCRRAERRADDHRPTFDAVGLRDLLDDFCPQRGQGCGLGGARREKREARAIQPRNFDEPEVAEPLDHHRQQPVADAMPEHVIDEIELLQRQTMNRHTLGAFGEPPLEPPEKLAARVGAGPFIVFGDIVEAREMSATLCDVAEGKTGDPAIGRFGDLRNRHGVFEMARRSVAPGQARFADMLDTAGRRQRRPDRLRQSLWQHVELLITEAAVDDVERRAARFDDAAVVANHHDAIEIVGDDLVQHGARLVALAGRLRVHPPSQAQGGDQAAEREDRQRSLDARRRRHQRRPLVQTQRACL